MKKTSPIDVPLGVILAAIVLIGIFGMLIINRLYR